MRCCRRAFRLAPGFSSMLAPFASSIILRRSPTHGFPSELVLCKELSPNGLPCSSWPMLEASPWLHLALLKSVLSPSDLGYGKASTSLFDYPDVGLAPTRPAYGSFSPRAGNPSDPSLAFSARSDRFLQFLENARAVSLPGCRRDQAILFS